MSSYTNEELADRYGAYASFQTESSPALVDYYGEDPAKEVKRLLDIYIHPESRVLDVGCGAGQTICQIAPKAKGIRLLHQHKVFVLRRAPVTYYPVDSPL